MMVKKRDYIIKPIAGILLVAAIIAGAFVLFTTLALNKNKDFDGEGASATGEVREISDAFFVFNAKKINVAYPVDGETVNADLMTRNSDIKTGSQVELYYNKRVHNAAINEETAEIYRSSLLPIMYIAGGGFVIMQLLRWLLWVIENGKKGIKQNNRDVKRDKSQSKYDRYLKKNPDFWMERYEAMKDRKDAYLTTSLKKRKKLVSMAGDKRDLYCAAYYDLMILQFGSMCDGISAYESGKESLKYPKEFKKISDNLEGGLGYNMYAKSMMITASLSPDREEAARLSNEVIRDNKDQYHITVAKEMLQMMEEFPKWSDFQWNFAHHYYSRTNPELDRGEYSEGCAILMTILEREGQPGYDLSEEEYVNILDDCLMLSLKHFLLLLYTGYNSFLNNRTVPLSELSFILQRPLKKLLEFLPDCEEKRFREIFKSDLREYAEHEKEFKDAVPEYQKACKMLGLPTGEEKDS